MSKPPDTVFVDIDGTIVPFTEDIHIMASYNGDRLWSHGKNSIMQSAKKLAEWHAQGIKIILVTGRPESMRRITVSMLEFYGMIYDQLIMGCGSGRRFLINDSPDKRTTAYGLVIDRNTGIGGINLNVYE